MNNWKKLAILFTLISFGALKECYNILTSAAPDIAPNRTELIITSFLVTAVIIFFTLRFWKKSADKKLY